MMHPSRSNAATLDEAFGSPFTPYRHERLGPSAGDIQRNLESPVVAPASPGLVNMGNTAEGACVNVALGMHGLMTYSSEPWWMDLAHRVLDEQRNAS